MTPEERTTVWVVTDTKFNRRIGPDYSTKREARQHWPSYKRYSISRELRTPAEADPARAKPADPDPSSQQPVPSFDDHAPTATPR